MNQENFPQNVLPKELSDLPFGQLFVLNNPFLGITSKNIFIMQFIFSMAKQYEKHHMVNAIPVEYSGLWDCVACKVQTCNGPQILIADNNSLVKMLCEFWGLDYEEVSKTVNIASRYKDVTMNATSPMRVAICSSIKVSAPSIGLSSAPYDPTLGFIQTHTKERALGDIRCTLLDNSNYGLGISLEELIDIYKSVESGKKTYSLDINIEKKDVIEKAKTIQKIKSCDIILIDNEGEKHSLKLEVYCKALYLTFILFEKGIGIKEISGDEEFYNTFKKIYLSLPHSSKASLPKQFDLWSDNKYLLFIQKIGKIRDAIMDITNDNYNKEKFAVEGNKGEAFKVAGATEELRETIKREFGIK